MPNLQRYLVEVLRVYSGYDVHHGLTCEELLGYRHILDLALARVKELLEFGLLRLRHGDLRAMRVCGACGVWRNTLGLIVQ